MEPKLMNNPYGFTFCAYAFDDIAYKALEFLKKVGYKTKLIYPSVNLPSPYILIFNTTDIPGGWNNKMVREASYLWHKRAYLLINNEVALYSPTPRLLIALNPAKWNDHYQGKNAILAAAYRILYYIKERKSHRSWSIIPTMPKNLKLFLEWESEINTYLNCIKK